MQLSKKNLKQIHPTPGLIIPDEELFALPEKVLQFGTGVLLRGLPDYFIDKANRNGIFNGRVVIVKSTSTGGTDEFSRQDGLYTLCIRGIENEKKVEETIINSSISRVLAATEEWDTILKCAHNPDLQVIISNTTEVGIALTEDNIHATPPLSFPGKLLSFLYERYKAFGGTEDSGMVIVPTELIINNGTTLYTIVLELATKNNLESGFTEWLQSCNYFCNSLVDRIVPGKLPEPEKIRTEKEMGYTDDLMIMAESFSLWAIESDNEKVRRVLSFSESDEGVVITPEIEKFRELKLRLLNGTHTFSCGLAYLAGFTTVREAMEDEHFSSYIYELMLDEITPAITGASISHPEAASFAKKVMDRFRNPYLDHQWINIAMQYSSKMKMRNIPLLIKHYLKTSRPPGHMALGFAAFLLFMKGRQNGQQEYQGEANATNYALQDDNVAFFAGKWGEDNGERIVESVLSDKNFWGTDLSQLNGFSDAVKVNLRSLIKNGALETLRRSQLHKTGVGR